MIYDVMRYEEKDRNENGMYVDVIIVEVFKNHNYFRKKESSA